MNTHRKNQRWTSEEDNVIREFWGKIRPQVIHEKIGFRHTIFSLKTRAGSIGAKSERGTGMYRKSTVNDEYFSVLTPENCYWAGFIAADGHLPVAIKRQVIITLSCVDKDHIERFRKCIGLSSEIRTYKSSCKNGYKNSDYCRIIVTSEKIRKQLQDVFSVTPRKSLTYKPPKIVGDDLISSFIVGYIDGDGSIRIRENNLQIRMLGTMEFLNWVSSYLNSKYPSRWNKTGIPSEPRISKKTSLVYEWGFHGKRMDSWAEYILGLGLPLMERKWGKVRDYLKEKRA